jgi:3-oxoacyl-[acyl-carrier-protein] synthase-3
MQAPQFFSAQRPGREFFLLSIRSDGKLADLLYRPSGGATNQFSQQILDDRSYFVRMAGREVFKHAVRSMSESADRALDAARLTGEDIDLLIPHQANVRIIEATAKHSNIPMDKVYVNVDRFGNTSSASIPIAIDEAIEVGRIKEGRHSSSGGVWRRLHVGVHDHPLLTWTSYCCSRGKVLRSGNGERSR